MVMVSQRQRSQKRRNSRGLMDHVVWHPVSELKIFPGNPRRHPEGQIAGLMKSIRRFWTNPILVDETGTILAGHGRWEAAKRLGRWQRHDHTSGRTGRQNRAGGRTRP